MKNLLIYTSPDNKFSDEADTLMKIQIDNSLQIGWKPDDILVVTNFSWQYNGISSFIVPYLASESDPPSNKVYVIKYLIEKGFLDDEETYWYHDYDAYENVPIQDDIKSGQLVLTHDFALCKYGYKDEFQCGMFFFKPSAIDIFNAWIKQMAVRPRPRSDEKCFRKIAYNSQIRPFQELDVAYNFTFKFIQTNHQVALKPLRVVHFHPYFKDYSMYYTPLDIFMHGKNYTHQPLMRQELIDIFQRHGIK